MEQRERLIELIIESVNGCARNWAEVIADHLLKNGVIVPPCKVGDTVYRVVNRFYGKSIIVEGCVFNLSIARFPSGDVKYRFLFLAKADKRYASGEHSAECDFTEIGKTVFLSREDAKKALAERGKP